MNTDEIISLKNKNLKSLIITGYPKKIHGIEQNHTQNSVMISKLPKCAFVKRSASLGIHITINFKGFVTIDSTTAYLVFKLYSRLL